MLDVRNLDSSCGCDGSPCKRINADRLQYELPRPGIWADRVVGKPVNTVKIAIYHGYELSGSGSNEYTRYLARTLAELGHDVAVVCAEPHPEDLEFVARAVAYDAMGSARALFSRERTTAGEVSLHQLPHTSVHPVFLTDKQRRRC